MKVLHAHAFDPRCEHKQNDEGKDIPHEDDSYQDISDDLVPELVSMTNDGSEGPE